jgi:hypothetical protein
VGWSSSHPVWLLAVAGLGGQPPDLLSRDTPAAEPYPTASPLQGMTSDICCPTIVRRRKTHPSIGKSYPLHDEYKP